MIDGCGRRSNGRHAMLMVAAAVKYLGKGREKSARLLMPYDLQLGPMEQNIYFNRNGAGKA